MTDATLTPTKGQVLKDTLELLFHAPERFDASPLCQPRTLHRILGEQYELLVADRLSPRDMGVEGLKRLTAQLVLEALRQDDMRLAEGLVLIWYQYLEPILSGSARSISPVARVLAYCAQPNNLREFWREVQNVCGTLDKALQSIPLFRDVSANGHGLEQAAKKQRRTYANYIQRAFETLAKTSELIGFWEIGVVAPIVEIDVTSKSELMVEVEAPTEVAYEQAAHSSMMDAVVTHILEKCCQLPSACGRTLPTAWAIERTIEKHVVKGEPLCPSTLPGTLTDVKRMSGVLAGVPGGGRTSVLYQVAYAWANAWAHGQSLAIYIRAPEFLVYARNRRSINEFTARQVLPLGSRGEIESLGKELEEYEQTYGVLWLMDDMDRLPEPDQGEVVMQMAFSPAALYAALPWEADRVARQMYPPDVGVFGLMDLSKAQQKEILDRLFALHPEAKVNQPIGYLALLEVPYLARLPLGIMAIFDQLLTNIADRVHVAQRALDEYFVRAGLSRPQFTEDWLALDPTVRALIVLAGVAGADMLWYQDEGIFTPRIRFEHGNGWTPECRWELLTKTRLFEPHPKYEDVCRFFNGDIMGYLIAKSETAAQLFAHAQIAPSNFITTLTEAVFQFKLYAEAWQSESAVSTQLAAM